MRFEAAAGSARRPPGSSPAAAGGPGEAHSEAGPARAPPTRRAGRTVEAGLWAGVRGARGGDSAAASRLSARRQGPSGRQGWCLRAVAPPRAAIAGPVGQSCAPPSPPVAERSRAAGLTRLPPTRLASPPRPGKSPPAWPVSSAPSLGAEGGGLSSGPPAEEASVQENHLYSAAPEAPVGTIVSRRVPEDPPALAGLLSACARSLTSWLDEQPGAPIATS